jgi:hypothetical protein
MIIAAQIFNSFDQGYKQPFISLPFELNFERCLRQKTYGNTENGYFWWRELEIVNNISKVGVDDKLTCIKIQLSNI